MEKTTTIKISRKAREEIERRKIHPRQTNEEIIEQALSSSQALIQELPKANSIIPVPAEVEKVPVNKEKSK